MCDFNKRYKKTTHMKKTNLRGSPQPRKTKHVNDVNYLNQRQLDSGLSKLSSHDLVCN
jgi:hypothetical protein